MLLQNRYQQSDCNCQWGRPFKVAQYRFNKGQIVGDNEKTAFRISFVLCFLDIYQAHAFNRPPRCLNYMQSIDTTSNA